MLKRYIKGLFEDRKTKQSANPVPIMTSKNKSGFGFIKGFIRFRHTIASAFVIIPGHPEASNSLIDPYGMASQSPMSVSGLATSSLITGSAGALSLIDINGMATTSTINPNGIASESNV